MRLRYKDFEFQSEENAGATKVEKGRAKIPMQVCCASKSELSAITLSQILRRKDFVEHILELYSGLYVDVKVAVADCCRGGYIEMNGKESRSSLPLVGI